MGVADKEIHLVESWELWTQTIKMCEVEAMTLTLYMYTYMYMYKLMYMYMLFFVVFEL